MIIIFIGHSRQPGQHLEVRIESKDLQPDQEVRARRRFGSCFCPSGGKIRRAKRAKN